MKIIFLILFVSVNSSDVSLRGILREFQELGRSELWSTGRMKMFGLDCIYTRVPKFAELDLQFEARVQCEKTTHSGQAKDRDPQLAVALATKNFAKNAFEGGIITEKQARPWLQ